jgi:hypothetical protein
MLRKISCSHTLAADLYGQWTSPTKKTLANHRQERHERHAEEGSRLPKPFLGDNDRDGEVTVTMKMVIDRHPPTP